MYVHSCACILSSQPWVPAEGIQDKDSVLVLHRSRLSNTMIGASFSCRVKLGLCSASCTGATPTWVPHTLLGISKTRWRDRVQQTLRAMLHVRKWSFPGKFWKNSSWSLTFSILEGPRLQPASQTLPGSQFLSLVGFRRGLERKPRELSVQYLGLFNNIHLRSLYFRVIWTPKEKAPRISAPAMKELVGDGKENAQPGNIPKLEADLRDWVEKYLHWI